jgi:hypothetical protein
MDIVTCFRYDKESVSLDRVTLKFELLCWLAKSNGDGKVAPWRATRMVDYFATRLL